MKYNFICLYKSKALIRGQFRPTQSKTICPFESWNPLTPHSTSYLSLYTTTHFLAPIAICKALGKKCPSLWNAPYIYEYLLYKRTYTYYLRVLVSKEIYAYFRATLDEVSINKKKSGKLRLNLKWQHFGRKINWFQTQKKKKQKQKQKASYKRRAHDLKTQEAS